jgi:hypothetical protein
MNGSPEVAWIDLPQQNWSHTGKIGVVFPFVGFAGVAGFA